MSRRKRRRAARGGAPAPLPAAAPAETENEQTAMPAPEPVPAEAEAPLNTAEPAVPVEPSPFETENRQETIPDIPFPEPIAEAAPVESLPSETEDRQETMPDTPSPEPVMEAVPVEPLPSKTENWQETIPDIPSPEPVVEAAPVEPMLPETESWQEVISDALSLDPAVEAETAPYAVEPAAPAELLPSETEAEQTAIAGEPAPEPEAVPAEPSPLPEQSEATKYEPTVQCSATDFKGRSFLTLLDYTPEEITVLLDLAAALKKKKKQGVPHRMHEGKNIALVFEKTSTRTRCSFEVAAADLGIHPTYLDPKSSQLGKKESIADTARVLGRMYDGIEYRGFGQEIVEALAKYSGVPVWNGLTNEFHPTQVLADLLTIRERFGTLKGIKLVYLGDARYNMGNSLMVGCAKLGLDFVACAPAKYFPNIALVQRCRQIAAGSGSTLRFLTDPEEAVQGAHVLYTDVWVSMGEPDAVWEERIADLTPYRVTKQLMDKARPDCVFMHCLPAFHDLNTGIGREIYNKFGIDCMEVTDEVFEGERSIVFDEAENRMHTIKAVMAATL